MLIILIRYERERQKHHTDYRDPLLVERIQSAARRERCKPNLMGISRHLR